VREDQEPRQQRVEEEAQEDLEVEDEDADNVRGGIMKTKHDTVKNLSDGD